MCSTAEYRQRGSVLLKPPIYRLFCIIFYGAALQSIINVAATRTPEPTYVQIVLQFKIQTRCSIAEHP